MCYKFAQEEEEITRSCKHKHIFSFKCDFHKASFSMWDFLPSLRLRIFSALVGDFSENQKEKLARVQKKEKIDEQEKHKAYDESLQRQDIAAQEEDNGQKMDPTGRV